MTSPDKPSSSEAERTVESRRLDSMIPPAPMHQMSDLDATIPDRRQITIDEHRLALAIAERFFQREESKQIIKEAITEWINTHFHRGWRHVIQLTAALAFISIIYLIIWSQFWHPKP